MMWCVIAGAIVSFLLGYIYLVRRRKDKPTGPPNRGAFLRDLNKKMNGRKD